MSRRRKARAKPKRPTPRVVERRPIPPLALVFAGLFTGTFVTPFLLWGNRYPEGVVPYWVWGTVVAAAVGLLVTLSPLKKLLTLGAAALVRPTPPVFALLAAVLATGLSLAFALAIFRRSPTSSDEIAQLWHAKMLLRGRLFLAPDPNPEFFSLENVIDVGRWYSQFPIGGPVVLAIGAAIGAPWLVNPVFCGLAAAAFYHFARRAYGETQGRAAALVFVLAPMVLLMAGTWMNHVPVLALATATLAALVEWERAASLRRRVVFASLMGLALGAMATIRPVDAVIVASVVGAFQLWIARQDWSRLRDLLVQGVVGALAVGPLLYANAITNGHALRFGYDVMWGPGHSIGFHADPYGNVHTIGRAFEYAITYVSELNVFLTAWPVPVLLITIIGLLTMRHVTRWDGLLLALFAAQVVTYASYGLVGSFLGPRFLYTALPAVIVLVSRTPFLLGERLGERWQWGAATLMVASAVLTWCVTVLPHGGWGLVNQARGVRRNMRVDIAGAVGEANVHRGVVFMREPFGSRLQRRLWGAGFPRADAARLLQSRDGCSLLAAVRTVESDTGLARSAKVAMVVRASAPLVQSNRAMLLADRTTRISGPESMTPECKAELESDARLPRAVFGPALALEPIDAAGRINGDIVFVADLGDRNEVLRTRFGDRPWYRLAMRPTPDRPFRAEVVPY